MELDAPVLAGDGFVLRVLEVADAEAWKAGEDQEQIRWFEAPGPAPMENVVRSIEAWRDGWARGGSVRQWGIWSEAVLCGGVELRMRDDGRVSASYVVFPPARRRGLASSSLRLAAAWAFRCLGASAVVAVMDELNGASRGVATKAGFAFEAMAEPWEHGESGVMLRYVLPAPG